MADLAKLREAIINGDAKAAGDITNELLALGEDPMVLIKQGMVPAMDEVGQRYECEDFFVPDLLLAARAMKAALAPLRPLLAASGAPSAGKVVIGTVKGDLHDIGKNLVASLLEGGGFEVIDLGADVAPQKFIETVQATGANIVALSALLTVTMPSMKLTLDALTEAGLRDKVKVMVGGAPVTQQFADQIGADGYTENATLAVAMARRLVAGA
jgi:corrinoid protein of di/trimethylamine methyltransferase